jgi:hypothetical protein
MKAMQVLVFLALAAPFIYMAYDIIKDIIANIKQVLGEKAKPIVISIINSISK